MNRKRYPSDLTDAQWALLEPWLRGPDYGNPKEHDLRDIVDAIFYKLKTGCQWDYLPGDFPPKSDVWYHFNRLRQKGAWARALDALNAAAREQAGRAAEPTALLIDSQTVSTSNRGEERGFDGNKKLKGRKRHILTDVLGLLLAFVITAANVHDVHAVAPLLDQAQARLGGLGQVQIGWVDQGYAGKRVAQAWKERLPQARLVVVRRPKGAKTFTVLKKRWVVERTLAWAIKHRQLLRDHERTVRTSGQWLELFGIRLALNRVAPRDGRDRALG